MPSSQMPAHPGEGVVRAAAQRAAAARSAVQGRGGPRRSKLGDYFGRKPVMLTFVYYECPMLCTQVLNGLESSLLVLDETVGKEFDVVTVSFDPRETPVLASGQEEGVSRSLQAAGSASGLAFPDRRRGVDRGADQGRRVPVTAWDERRTSSRTPAASSSRRRPGQVSRYFFGHRVFAARRQVRADRVVEREDRQR